MNPQHPLAEKLSHGLVRCWTGEGSSRTGLTFLDCSVCDAADEGSDLLSSQRSSVSLLPDQIWHGRHVELQLQEAIDYKMIV